jgi:ribonuclease VapC
MTAVLDASAIVALVADEPGGAEVAERLGADGGSCSAVNLAEVLDWLIRIGGVEPTEARGAIDAIIAAGLVVVPGDRAIAITAAELRARWYHRRFAAVSLADCFAVATALELSSTLVTSDGALGRMAVRAGADVYPIRNSLGRRPQTLRLHVPR